MQEDSHTQNRNYHEDHHILVVDDDVRICELVTRYLDDHGFVVVSAHNAEEAGDAMRLFTFDALVLDVMMPGVSGFELAQDIRKESDIPIIFLTALGEVEDRLQGFDAGGDDYLPKPFEPKELVMRLQAILKRSVSAAAKSQDVKIRIGDWVFDPAYDELVKGEQVLALTSAETALIKALAQKPGEVMSRDELAQILNVDAGERTIDVQVTRLRRKIEDDPKMPRLLQTVRGKGYLLRAEMV